MSTLRCCPISVRLTKEPRKKGEKEGERRKGAATFVEYVNSFLGGFLLLLSLPLGHAQYGGDDDNAFFASIF